jgi:hypothetical protein
MEAVKQQLSAVLNELCEEYPEWRFGQLVANVAAWAGTDEPANIWDVSDADLLQAARDHLARKQDTAAR